MWKGTDMTRILKTTAIVVIAILPLTACQYEELNRSEFMSASAGNAIAHNSALQIIDPWPRMAGNNDLRVPVGKYGGEPKTDEGPPSPIIIQASGAE
ncbi:MAG: hypothetical protein GY742_10695 [Hyphomicrobiales bacterium]|nr:hypothetical protein [Hyphomicrobiales bacterium]